MDCAAQCSLSLHDPVFYGVLKLHSLLSAVVLLLTWCVGRVNEPLSLTSDNLPANYNCTALQLVG